MNEHIYGSIKHINDKKKNYQQTTQKFVETIWFVVKIDKFIWKWEQKRKKKPTNWKLLHRFQIGHLLWRVINQRIIYQADDVFFLLQLFNNIKFKVNAILCCAHSLNCRFFVCFRKVVDVNGKLFPTISNWFIALFSIHLFHAT